MRDICRREHKINEPSFADINKIAAQTIAGITCSLRLPCGPAHSNMRKVSINLIPFPRMHFFVTSMWPWNKIKA